MKKFSILLTKGTAYSILMSVSVLMGADTGYARVAQG